MFYHLDFAVPDLTIDPMPLEFKLHDAHSTHIRFHMPTEEDVAKGTHCTNLLGSATTQRSPNSRVASMFADLVKGVLPEGSDLQSRWLHYDFDASGKILPNHVVHLEVMPQPFREFVNQVSDELLSSIRRLVGILRWRYDVRGPHTIAGRGGMRWSYDGQEWHPMPHIMQAETRLLPSLRAPYDTERGEVEALLDQGAREPLGRELYREAWEQRHVNPRSSLIMAVAAAEAGFKEFAAALEPAVSWLLSEMPSPDLVKLLRDYIPKLPATHVADTSLAPPPKQLLQTIQVAVGERNKIAHAGRYSFGQERLDDTLLAINDLLWIFDYYRGYTWAVVNIRSETRRAMGLPI